MIKFTQVYELLQRVGIPVTYKQFDGPKQEIPDPPYIVYYETRSSNIGADNVTYTEMLPVIVELYTDRCRSLELERRIKDLLTEAGLYFNTDHGDVPKEDAHIAYFEFSIIE